MEKQDRILYPDAQSDDSEVIDEISEEYLNWIVALDDPKEIREKLAEKINLIVTQVASATLLANPSKNPITTIEMISINFTSRIMVLLDKILPPVIAE